MSAGLYCGLGCTPAVSVSHCAAATAICGLWRYISCCAFLPFRHTENCKNITTTIIIIVVVIIVIVIVIIIIVIVIVIIIIIIVIIIVIIIIYL